MASTKRRFPEEEEEVVTGSLSKKAKESESDASLSSPRVLLNPADCDLDFNVDRDGLVGYGLHEEGFAYCWSGARANVGITKGRYCFGCIVVSAQPVHMEDTATDQKHVCRLGISRGDNAVGNLGETKHSFGYGGTSMFSNAGKFSKFGDWFGVGDTIVCCVDLESKPLASISFSKNGKWLGVATQFDAGPSGLGVVDSALENCQWKSALFPHVLLKNVVVQMQFSIEDGLVPEQGFKPWASVVEDRNMVMGPVFSDLRDCEVVMMVGLPASGKTTWAEKWVKDQPEKRYVLLGTNLILDQMKVPGLLRKNNYGERFDRLMDRATGIFNILLSRAASICRNYIIDQTNVYKSARRRKLKPFADFQKIAAVVFPEPKELQKRSAKRFKEMGKEVPTDAVNNMIANYDLPKSYDMPFTDEYFDKVTFVELNRDESKKYLDQMKQDIASKANNNSSTVSRRGSFESFAGSGLQNIGSSTGFCLHAIICLLCIVFVIYYLMISMAKHFGSGSGIHQPGCYPSTSPCNDWMPNQVSQVNANSGAAELHGTLSSFSGGYSRSQIPHVARAPYFNNEPSCFPRDIAGYNQTYGAIPTADIRTYNSSVVGGPYRPNIVGNNMVFRDAFRDPYRSATNEPSLIASADSRTRYGTPIPRPPHGSLPHNMPYSARYASQRHPFG